ncbi:MAG: TlpA family protein disulfide reductase [Pseudomonadales bacterium]
MRISRCTLLLLVSLFLTACDSTESNNTSEPNWKVINFWAVWCAPCREEIPELNKLAKQYADQLLVQGVNFDAEDDQPGVEQAASMGIEFDTISTADAGRYGLQKPSILPTTFVLKNGQLHAELKGPQTFDELVDLMALSSQSE